MVTPPVMRGMHNPNPQRMSVNRHPINGSSKETVRKARVAQLVTRVMTALKLAPDWYNTAMRGKTT
jgi:hypothetical protein